MSDTHEWSGADETGQVVADLRACEDRVRVLVHACDRDDPDRAGLVELWGALTQAADRLEQLTPAPRPVAQKLRLPQRRVGEDTDAWLAGRAPSMRRNRGPQ